MPNDKEDDKPKAAPSWQGLMASQISPAYVVALIAAAAVMYSQVSELRTGFIELRRDKESLALQISTLNTQQLTLTTSITDKFAALGTSIDKNSDSLERSMGETRSRLRAIEQSLAKLAAGSK